MSQCRQASDNEFMAIRRSRELRPSAMDKVDGVLFAFAGLATIWLAYLVFRASIQPGWPMLLLIVFWVLLTYLLLPRLHRILIRLYVPGYFIGRARTSDGLLGDPVNLALRGHEAQVHAAMTRAGWTRADDLSMTSGMRILTSTLRRRSYSEAPVSPLHLFDRQQDFAYQQEVAGSPSKRHHVRFWRCPEGWMLPGGYAVDWLAAGTYDKSVGLSLFTLQVTHKIEEDTDVERDHIVETIKAANPEVDVEAIDNFCSPCPATGPVITPPEAGAFPSALPGGRTSRPLSDLVVRRLRRTFTSTQDSCSGSAGRPRSASSWSARVCCRAGLVCWGCSSACSTVQSGRHPGNSSARHSRVRPRRPHRKHRLGTLGGCTRSHTLGPPEGKGHVTRPGPSRSAKPTRTRKVAWNW
jgi:LssY C-terminus